MPKKIKALKEQHNSLLDKIDKLYEKGISETRGLTNEEDNEILSLKEEAAKLKAEIENEERSIKDAEILNNKGEKNMNLELETRGIEDFIRGIDSEEVRGMTTADGKGIVPANLDKQIIKNLDEVAPLFAKVKKFTPVAGTLSIPVEESIGECAWVGEDAGTTDSKFKLKTVDLTQRRAGSEIVLSQYLINDSGIDITSYSKEILFRRLGYAIDRAMITGTVASKSVEGLNNTPSDREYPGDFEIDTFIGAMTHMKAEYQNGAEWIMNRKTFEELNKLKNAIGELYVVRDVVNGKVIYKLFGAEIRISDAVGENDVFLANIPQAYRGMIKKGALLTKIDSDTQNRRSGTVTLVLDTYVDARIVQPEALLRIKLNEKELRTKTKAAK